MTSFLIAGLGSVGRRHLRNLQALGEHDVVLLRSGRSTLPEDELAGLPSETDLEVALARWRPDGVIVANPTAYHLDVAIPAARAGCHLLIEKPVSHSLARLDDLRSAAAQGGARILVGFQFRFHPGMQEVKRAIEEGRIGQPLYARAHWGEYLPAWHPWEDYRLSYAARADLGGGVILTLSHPFDYLRWILGEAEPLTSVAGTFGDLGLTVEDMAEVTLRFPGGALAALHLDYLQTPPSHWLEIAGSHGMLRWDNADGAVRRWSPEEGAWTVTPAPEGFERNTMFLEEMRHFVSVVHEEAEPRVTLEDGARALALAVWASSSALRPAARNARSEGGG